MGKNSVLQILFSHKLQFFYLNIFSVPKADDNFLVDPFALVEDTYDPVQLQFAFRQLDQEFCSRRYF